MFGQAAHVVLYHFGGLAIPEAWGRRHLRPLQRLLVSAAGPLAQLALAAAVVAVLKVAGYCVPFPLRSGRGDARALHGGRRFASPLAFAFVDFLLYVNVFWPLLNLVPVPPLDGGQIVREGLLALGVDEAPRIAGVIGVVVGGAVAWWGYTRGEPYLGIMFAMLAVVLLPEPLRGNTPWRRWN